MLESDSEQFYIGLFTWPMAVSEMPGPIASPNAGLNAGLNAGRQMVANEYYYYEWHCYE